MTLTVGTDTYISVTDADTYFGNRLYSTAWTGADSGDKEKALRMAAKALDREAYAGTVTSQTQAMAWPRSGVLDLAGREIDGATVPTAVIDAQCELALAYLTDDPTQDDGTRGVRRMVADTVTMEYDGRAPVRRLPDFVFSLIRPFLASGSPSTASAPLVF